MTIQNDLQTIRDYLRYAMSRFHEAGLYYGHGTDNAWDEALALVLHTLHLPHHVDPTMLDANLTQDERKKLIELINQRVNHRIPVPYLTHEAWYAGLPFYVDERVLVPRSPIAELIQNHFQPWVEPEDVTRILDLCTGSGCIAIACAKAFPDASIDASDISSDALAVAKINVLKHGVEEQVTLHESDLLDGLANQQYDIIVSNPPYVDAEDMATLPNEYLHEPKHALAAGEDGLVFAERILKDAKKHLKPNGVLIVEVGNSEYALADKYPEIPFTWLEFEHGGGGVFLLTAEQLNEFTGAIQD
jgi:ribosomal protein L3 glutamine methyltransferase